MTTLRLFLRSLAAAGLIAAASPVLADDDNSSTPWVNSNPWFDSGKLLATGGVSQLEGAGGGGLVPWALITGYGTDRAVGANVHYTYVGLSDFTLQTGGVAIGLFDRVELSYAHQMFDTRSAGARLGLGKNFTIHQDVLGAKIRLFGDAIFDQDKWLPQVAIGAQYKSNNRGGVIRAIGGKDEDGIDYYLAASKLFLGQSMLVNATVRATRANQFGILGFGGDKNDDYTAQFEGSVAYLLSRNLAIGAEYRMKPDNLSFAKEENAADLFVAYFFNKNISATLAYVGLGDIARETSQNGVYFSLQIGM